MSPVRGPNDESYDEYYKTWLEEQKNLYKELLDGLNSDMAEDELQKLVQKAKRHYVDYYEAKGRAAKQDVLKVMHPTWKSPLENAFLWIGGWRPTMVFQLAYAQAGQQIEAELAEFLEGIHTQSMAALSSKQLSRISDLQIQKQKAEDELGHKQAVLEQSLVDNPLLSLAQQADAALGGTSEDGDRASSLTDALDEKVKALEELLFAADELRLESLKDLLDVLTTTQAAQYLVAAGQLHVAVAKIGMEKQKDDVPPS